MTRDGLLRLASLAEARRARDLARLDALTAETRRLEAEITDLAATGTRDAAEGALPFAMLAGRAAWADAEIAARERRLGAIALEIAGARAAARASLGKHEALLRLVARAERDARAGEDRAVERMAPPAARRPL